MAIFKNMGSNIKNATKRMFGASELKQGFQDNRSMLQNLYHYNMKKFKPNYEEYLLSKQQYSEVQKVFRRLFYLFLLLFGLAILYVFVCLFNHNWSVSILALCFATLCAAFAFRYHFWLYQLRRQNLGCKFSDWYRDVIQSKFKK